MENTAITITDSVNNDAIASIKSEECRLICQDIANVISDTLSYNASKTRLVAIKLASVTKDMYTAEGYKSLADFASDKFGFKKQLAHSLVKAGHMYTDDSISDTIKQLSPSKIVELARVTIAADKGVKDAMTDAVNEQAAELATMTQANLRAFADTMQARFSATPVPGSESPNTHSPDEKARKVTFYDVVVLGATDENAVNNRLIVYSALGAVDLKESETLLFPMDDVKAAIKAGKVFKAGTFFEDTRYIAFGEDGTKPVAFTMAKHEEPKAAKTPKASKVLTADDIKAMSPDEMQAAYEALAALMGK